MAKLENWYNMPLIKLKLLIHKNNINDIYKLGKCTTWSSIFKIDKGTIKCNLISSIATFMLQYHCIHSQYYYNEEMVYKVMYTIYKGIYQVFLSNPSKVCKMAIFNSELGEFSETRKLYYIKMYLILHIQKAATYKKNRTASTQVIGTGYKSTNVEIPIYYNKKSYPSFEHGTNIDNVFNSAEIVIKLCNILLKKDIIMIDKTEYQITMNKYDGENDPNYRKGKVLPIIIIKHKISWLYRWKDYHYRGFTFN